MVIFCENNSILFYVLMGEARPLKHLLRRNFVHHNIIIYTLFAEQVFVALQAQIRIILPSSCFQFDSLNGLDRLYHQLFDRRMVRWVGGYLGLFVGDE